MENIENKRRWSKWLCTWVCSIALLSGSFCFAADDELRPGELLKKSLQQMRVKDYKDAVITMSTYLDMVEKTTASGVIKISQDLRFKMITILIETGRLDEAAPALQDYIDKPLGEYPRRARTMLATCLFSLEKYKESVVASANALAYNEDPTSNAGRRELTPDEQERYAKYAEKDFELEYTDEEVTSLYMTMAEANYKSEQWEACIEPYEYVAEHTKNEQNKGYAIMQMINAMVAMPAFDQIAEWIPKLYRTPARYDIRVNLALMNVAAALYDEGDFDAALPLYRMILPRDELLAYQEGRLREMRIKNALAPVADMDIPIAEQILFPGKEEKKDEEGGDEVLTPTEVTELEELIQMVKNLPSYEIDNQYRMAQIYEEVERYWEAAKFFEVIHKAAPETKMGSFSAYQLVKILLQELDALPEAEEHGFAYMEKQKTGLESRQIAYLFTMYHQKADNMDEIKALRPYLDNFVRVQADNTVTNGTKLYSAIERYDVELYYMQAVADLVLYNFAECAEGFKLVIDEFPGSEQEGSALYWYGLSKLFLAQFADAFEVFEDYGKRFSTEQWVDEALYQGGVCLFGLAGKDPQPDYTAASNRFTYVITTYSNPNLDEPGSSSVFPEACNMRGDLYGAAGELRRAEDDYRTAIKHAVKPAQATYAVFQLAKVFKAEDDFDRGITLVEEYLAQWGAEADIAKALFWIGKSKLQKRAMMKDEQLADALVDEVVADYLSAIVEYGDDVLQDGVDMIIEELVNITSLWLDFDEQEALLAELKSAIEATDNLVLKLRLRVTIALITKTEADLGRRLLVELPDFESVSPPVLAAICKISIETKDYSRAEELLDIFKTKFEDSDFVREAYKLRSLGQFSAKDYDGALETISDVQGQYMDDSTMAWAQLMMAQILLEQGDFDMAISNNMMVLGVPAWRGEPVVQAYYQLGQVEEQAGLKESGEEMRNRMAFAHAYYQRVYFQFKGYANGYWAAEAYLAAARCLGKLDQESDRLNTYRAMLFDSFVNTLPQADVARKELGVAEVEKIETFIEEGAATNIIIAVEGPSDETTATDSDESEASEVESSVAEGEES